MSGRTSNVNRFTRNARVGGGTAIVVGLLVILGWLLDNDLLKSVLEGKIAMKPNTAICFVLIGAALLLLASPQQSIASVLRRRAARVCAVVVALISLASLSEILFGVDLRIDRLLFRNLLLAEADPGRMAATSALSFIFLCVTLLLLDAKNRIARMTVDLSALATLFLGAIALLGYLYQVEWLYRLAPFTPMALHTAFLFVVLALGVLLSRPDRGMMSVLTSEHVGGVMARRLLAVAVLLPVVLGWLWMKADQSSLFGNRLGLALFVVTKITLLGIWVWLAARSLNLSDARREQAQESLQQSKAQIAAVIDSAMDAIVTIDSEQQVLLFNDAAERMFRCTAAEAIGTSIDRFIPSRFRSSHSRHIQQFEESAFTTRTMSAARAVRGLRADGEEFPVEASISQIEVGGRKLFTVIMRDISEKTRAQQSLQASEQRYRRLFETAKDGILILDEDEGRILDANPFLAELLDYSKEELLGRELWEIGIFKDVIAAKAAFVELQKQTYIRYEDLPLKTRRSVVKQVEFISNSYLVNGGRVIQCNIRDISERKQAEEALRKSEESLRAFVTASSDVIYRMSPDWGTMRDLDGRNFILDTKEPTEGWLQNYIHPDDQTQVMAAITEAIRNKSTFEMEHRIRRVDGTLGWTFSRAIPVQDAKGEIVEWFGAASDVTDRKLAEEALRRSNEHLEQTLAELRGKSNEITVMTQQLWQASRLATVGELAASIAHELNNPLATISLKLETLAAQLNDDADKSRAVQIVTDEVERMGNLVGNLLQFSRRTHQQISTVNVAEEIDKSLELVEYHLRSNKIQVIREYPVDVPTIQADRQQLRQVFLNLLTNASDAIKGGGTVIIKVTRANDVHNRRMRRVQFIDSGAGIEPAILEKIWDPFFTTKPEGKGTGLGLAICRRVVEEHHGSIAIESEIGKGTKIIIDLPATSGEAEDESTLSDAGTRNA